MEKRKPERRDRTSTPRPAVGGRKRAVLGAIQKNRDKRVKKDPNPDFFGIRVFVGDIKRILQYIDHCGVPFLWLFSHRRLYRNRGRNAALHCSKTAARAEGRGVPRKRRESLQAQERHAHAARDSVEAGLGSRFARRVRFPMGREPPQGAVMAEDGVLLEKRKHER